MWMAEQINNYGIGNGISVILFAGIVARAPSVLSNMISYVKYGQLNIFVVLGIAVDVYKRQDYMKILSLAPEVL